MLKLYCASGACSISPHIALRESGLPFTLEKVNFQAGRKLDDGSSYLDVNPKGYVPALKLENGEVLTEGVAIIQYIADQNPEAKLAPPPGSFERIRLQEWLNFIATELHKGLSPLFASHSHEDIKTAAREKLGARIAFVEKSLGTRDFIFGDGFTIADGYLFYALRGWQRVKGTMSPTTAAYFGRLAARPAVSAALEAEGLTAIPS